MESSYCHSMMWLDRRTPDADFEGAADATERRALTSSEVVDDGRSA